MCNEKIQPPETNGTMFLLGLSLLGAEFVRGRVCQGRNSSGAEMSRNPGKGLASWLLCLLCFVTFQNMFWSTSELRARLVP